MGRPLKSIVRLRKWIVDEKRRFMADLLVREAQIVAVMRRLDEQIPDEGAAAAADALGSGRTFGAYLLRAKEQRERLEIMLEETRVALAEAQKAVSEAFEEFKSIDVAQINREEHEKKEEERKVQIVLDELGIEIFRRHGGSNSLFEEDLPE